MKNSHSNKEIDYEYHLQYIKTICQNNDCITSIDIFPSGKIISVSRDTSIIIWDENLILLEKINNAHNNYINDVKIKDENNFITCSYQNIKIWTKNNKKWICNQSINNAHNSVIFKILFCYNNKMISCSEDQTIKIWEETNNKFQLITSLSNSGCICSILIYEKNNILISTGDNTIIWNFQNFKIISKFDIECFSSNALQKIDSNRIIIGGGNDNILKIISISENKIIVKISSIQCMGICVLKNKNIFLIGGYSYDIAMYNSNNYQCILYLKDICINSIYGFKELNNGLIASYSCKNNMLIWEIKKYKKK